MWNNIKSITKNLRKDLHFVEIYKQQSCQKNCAPNLKYKDRVFPSTKLEEDLYLTVQFHWVWFELWTHKQNHHQKFVKEKSITKSKTKTLKVRHRIFKIYTFAFCIDTKSIIEKFTISWLFLNSDPVYTSLKSTKFSRCKHPLIR